MKRGMLVLTRRINENIHIGNDIVITVTRINRDDCRIGITAPKEVKILREECLGDDEQFQPNPR